MALPLAGGPIAFTAAELIERERRQLRAADVRWRMRSHVSVIAAPTSSPLIERVTAKRPPFAGLALDKPLLMGIVNVTPDSFSDGGLYDTTEQAIAHGGRACR